MKGAVVQRLAQKVFNLLVRVRVSAALLLRENMKLIKIVGIGKGQTAKETKIVGALKASNQTNPRSGGTTLVLVVKRKRNELGKKIRKDYENKKVKKTMKEIRDWEVVPQKNSNTISGVQIDNLIIDQRKK